MKIITTKLKRYKALNCLIDILLILIGLPLMILIYIGELSDKALETISNCLLDFVEKIAEVFKWDDIAEKKYYQR